MEETSYKDELRDFGLLYTNQLLLQIFMQEIPLESYVVKVMKDEKELIQLEYVYLGGSVETDTLSRFTFTATVKEKEIDQEDYFLDLSLSKTPVPVEKDKYYFPIAIEVGKRSIPFVPSSTPQRGEVLVNETFIWLKKIMAETMSGNN